ncbi:MAG TPA: glycosyltransferase family 2 protein [Bryobacteraceae bacterium]|nr:glycosyltransferase family 2 protein [Bryobacteraceae bacterium]
MTFNSEAVIGSCLDSLAKMAPNVTPIVVDNASSDRTVELARERAHVHIILNRENRGFAAAVNQGISACEADFLLLLNPDANLLTAVDALVDASQQYGLAAGKLVGIDRKAESGFTIRRLPTPASLIFELFGINRLWPSNPVNRRYRYLDRDLDEKGPVEQPAGAFLMTRRKVWKTLDGFDESFHPVWFEDVDYCKRALDSGYRIEYVPSVQAGHQGGHSVNKIPEGCRAIYWCVSLTRYAAKHFHSAGYRAVCLAVVLSSFPRMVARMIQDRSLQSVATYRKIVRFAGLCLVSPGRSAARGGRNS